MSEEENSLHRRVWDLEVQVNVLEARLYASRDMVSVRDAEITALKARVKSLKVPLTELYALVKGECPALLDEDSGGYSRLDMDIEKVLFDE